MTATRPMPAARLPRLLAGIADAAGLREYERRYGPFPGPGGPQARTRTWFPGRKPGRLIDIVEAAGLTGRGGAGFPAGRKMRSVAARPGRKAVVANGAEGEPASRKDRLLLSRLRTWSWTGSRWRPRRSVPTRPTCVSTGPRAACSAASTTRWRSAS